MGPPVRMVPMFMIMLVGLIFFAGVVMLFFKPTRFIAAVCLCLATVAPVVGFFFHAGDFVEQAATPHAVLEVQPEILIDADAHPSATLAVQSLVERLGRNVNEIVPDVTGISTIHYPWALPQPIATPLREELQKKFPFATLKSYEADDVDESFFLTLH